MTVLAAAERLLADHPLTTAVPFFVPCLVAAVVAAAIVWGDRRRRSTDRPDEPVADPSTRRPRWEDTDLVDRW